jgi:hypothetical protein
MEVVIRTHWRRGEVAVVSVVTHWRRWHEEAEVVMCWWSDVFAKRWRWWFGHVGHVGVVVEWQWRWLKRWWVAGCVSLVVGVIGGRGDQDGAALAPSAFVVHELLLLLLLLLLFTYLDWLHCIHLSVERGRVVEGQRGGRSTGDTLGAPTRVRGWCWAWVSRWWGEGGGGGLEKV